MNLFKKKSVLKEVLKDTEIIEYDTDIDVSKEYSEDSWKTLNLNDSKEGRFAYGKIIFYDKKDTEFVFKFTDKVDFKNKECGKEYNNNINSYVKGNNKDPKLYEYYSIFPGIIFVPKREIHPNWIVTSIYDLLAWYDLYKKIPYVINTHPKHGKYYEGKNVYRKLELIK